MSSHKYPRIGGKEHRPKNTSAVCIICGEVAKWRVEVQVNIFRGVSPQNGWQRVYGGQVLGQALALDPQAILPTVRESLQAEPALTGSPQLVLHPDDAALVREHLADDLQTAGWRIRADADTQRGGCRVLAASGERDATLQSRWDRVAAALSPHTTATAPLVHG